MIAIDRANIIQGPCLITYGGSTFRSKGDVVFKPVYARTPVPTASFGEVSQRNMSRHFEVSFEPDGRFVAALTAILWPYSTTPIGQSIYGTDDSPLVIHGRDGVKVTIHNAAVTEMPALRIGTAVTVQGGCKFVGLLANDVLPTHQDAYYAVASQAYPGDDDFNASQIITPGVMAVWGGAPFDNFHVEAGWELQFSVSLAPQSVDGLGVVDMTLTGLTATAQAIPVGPSVSQLMDRLGNNTAMGTAAEATGSDLTISGTGIHVVLKNAFINDPDLGWGTTRKRLGQTTWATTRSVTAGALDPLYTIGTPAPVATHLLR